MGNTLKQIKELSTLCNQIEQNVQLVEVINDIAATVIKAYKNRNKTFFCGNGGSSAEAQHLAAELSGRFKSERQAIPAEACHVNSSFVTAVSNDYDFTKVYSRYIEGFGQQGDVLIGLSTSGTSKNIINAFHAARNKGLTTIALTGKTGGDLNDLSDHIFKVPSDNVPRIQEMHLLVGHIICEKVEQTLFKNDK